MGRTPPGVENQIKRASFAACERTRRTGLCSGTGAGCVRPEQKYSLESLTIDKTGFTLRFLFPFGFEMNFSMADYGYPNLTVEKQETLLFLLEELVPKLTATDCYTFRSRRIKLLDGHVEYQYRYIIRTDYKNLLTRAPYYDGSLQSQVW